MILGIDFDNTIVSYDTLFYRVAVESGLVPSSVPANKTAVRDFLRQAGKEEDWTRMQGEVYGARMEEAEAYPGVKEFFKKCGEKGIGIRIVSHKTRHPFLGEKYDLHKAAFAWLESNGFFSGGGIGKPDVFFELTKAEKAARILRCGCDGFVDDLPEILADERLRGKVQRILFDPSGCHAAEGDWERKASSWAELEGWFCSGDAEG